MILLFVLPGVLVVAAALVLGWALEELDRATVPSRHRTTSHVRTISRPYDQERT